MDVIERRIEHMHMAAAEAGHPVAAGLIRHAGGIGPSGRPEVSWVRGVAPLEIVFRAATLALAHEMPDAITCCWACWEANGNRVDPECPGVPVKARLLRRHHDD